MGMLKLEIPIRGGIAIGLGIEINDNELFGPVIAKAYHMENEIAKYPRIAIDESVVEYINYFRYLESNNSRESTLCMKHADMCASMIGVDIDGVYILDYLCDPLLKDIFDIQDNKKILLAIENFANKEINKFKGNKNPELVRRYLLLKDYVARIKLGAAN